MKNKIISLTAQIVSAHVAANDISVGQLPGLIRDVYQALATIGQASADPIKTEPAVAVKNSVFVDHIVCLECGASLKMLKRHLASDHQMTPEEYRAKWNLPASYPMVAAEYAATRSQIAKDTGLGRKVKRRPRRRSRQKKNWAGRKVEAPLPPKKRGRPKKG